MCDMIKKMTIHFVALLLTLSTAAQQVFVPGQSYFGTNNYIEYIAGNMPLIITAPHGGNLAPASIPDRSCAGCTNVKDTNTEEMARALAQSVYERTGCYPHVIINRLHRKKLDANRDLPEAADGNVEAGLAWEDWHTFIQQAQNSVKFNFGKGFYVDLHGHGHTIQRLELGYLLYKTELQLTDSVLNTPAYINYSSIRNLASNNLNDYTHAELLRGPAALGSLLAAQGYPAVPSSPDPFPQTADDYFNGGYNTDRYSSVNGGTIDGVQIESNYDGVRNNLTNINRFTDSLAVSLLHYLREHYFGDLTDELCSLTQVANPGEQPLSDIFPNPSCGQFYIRQTDTSGAVWTAEVYSFQGTKLFSLPLPANELVRVSLLRNQQNVYVVLLRDGVGVRMQAVLDYCR